MCVCVCVLVPPGLLHLLAGDAVRGCVLGPGCSRALPLLAGVLGRLCVCVRAPLVPRHSWLGCAVWACVLGSGFGRAPPLLVGVLGCVCVRACAPFQPRHSWRGGVYVCGLGSRLLSGFPGFRPLVRAASVSRHLLRGRLWRGAVRVLPCMGFAPPPLVFFVESGRHGVSCRGFVVSVAGYPSVWSRGLRPPFPSRSGCAFVCFSFFFPSLPQRGVCLRVSGLLTSGGLLLSAWCCRFWLDGPLVPLQGVPSSVPSGCGVRPPLVVRVGGFLAVGPSCAPFPPFLFGGGLCLFLPLPPLSWCAHWSAFGVLIRVAVGACVLLGLAPAPWVAWVMYTFGSAALSAGLGSGSAGWAVAPAGFLRPWVRGAGVFGVSSPPRCRY